MYQGDEDDELQRLLEGRDEVFQSPCPKEPVRKRQRVDEVVPEREYDDLDDFIVRHPDDEVDSDEDERPVGADEAVEAPAKKTVRRVTLNPRPKLDADRLKSTKGLVSLLDQHSHLQLRGPGHEAEDLNRIMFAMEHWGHLLFPKMAFDDLIEKLEQLGSKKAVSVFVKKMRQGLPLDVARDHIVEEEEDDGIERGFDLAHDREQLNAEEAFDRVFGHETVQPDSATAETAARKEPVSLTEEQRQEIARKRLEALERRKERAAREELDRAAAIGESQTQERVSAADTSQEIETDSSQKEFMDMLNEAEIE